MSKITDEFLEGLAALPKNAAWRVFVEKLTAFSTQAAEAHEDEKRTPAQRAEWLHAMKMLRELTRWHAESTEKAKKFLRTHESR